MRMGIISTKSGLDLRRRLCGSNPAEKVHQAGNESGIWGLVGPWGSDEHNFGRAWLHCCGVPRDRVNLLNGLIISAATDDQTQGLNDLVACPAVRL
jgi:hypothetical protein